MVNTQLMPAYNVKKVLSEKFVDAKPLKIKINN